MVHIQTTINDDQVDFLCQPRQSLLDVLGWTGTKEGCNDGNCGACTVIMDGRMVTSCLVLAVETPGKQITTIEGIGRGETGLHPVQQAWIDEQVPQCGYCQSGQIMTAVALLEDNPAPGDDDIDAAMSGNICRCGTYSRIRRGIKRAAKTLASTSATEGSHNG